MILDAIVEKTKQRIQSHKEEKSLERLQQEIKHIKINHEFPFEKALATKEISFICEVKKTSPSKGVIAKDFPYCTIAKDYETAGASAISVLTEPDFFQGSDTYLSEIASLVNIPVLRKDFIIDPYQIYEAKTLGASAILLICAILDTNTLKNYISIAHSLGLSALVEVHDETELLSAIQAGARIIGVNNRDLKTFTVDLSTSLRLRKQIPEHIIFVSESGIKTPEDIALLRENGTNAVLIGETLMRSPNKKKQLAQLRGENP